MVWMIGLVIILILVLFLPFSVKKVEHNLEIFLFVMGIAAALVSGMMNLHLIEKALIDPITITLAVLIAGLVCKWGQVQLEKSILWVNRILSPRIFFGLTVIILGLASSIITAIIAAIVLVIIINVLPLDRKSEIRFTVLACFSIGLGAALTPIGEPLATITISKLNEDFFYLLKLIGPEVISAVVILGILTILLVKPQESTDGLTSEQKVESYKEILIRSAKIYLFVMGLTFLGHGFEPLINEYILGLHPTLLYWINMISAILDNATLAAAEISPAMDQSTIQAVLMGLIISGGMLIPGNIPNIIAAGKLNITSKEWASFGVPVGLITMAVYFVILFVI
ncbi:cation transporter [Neobacillus niacini]|nr:cation transporter [Neobacillus niacini]